MANGIAYVRKNRQFRVYVANFGRTPRLSEETDLKDGAVWPEDVEEQTKVFPKRFRGKTPNELPELISRKDFREDPRN